MSTYCTRAQIEAIYGATNVEKWADLDEDDDAANITARITDAIAVASEEIDDIARMSEFQIPLADSDSATPVTVRNTAATLAGIILYENRGTQDFNPRTGEPFHRLAFKRTQVRRFLAELRKGDRRIDAM